MWRDFWVLAEKTLPFRRKVANFGCALRQSAAWLCFSINHRSGLTSPSNIPQKEICKFIKILEGGKNICWSKLIASLDSSNFLSDSFGVLRLTFCILMIVHQILGKLTVTLINHSFLRSLHSQSRVVEIFWQFQIICSFSPGSGVFLKCCTGESGFSRGNSQNLNVERARHRKSWRLNSHSVIS